MEQLRSRWRGHANESTPPTRPDSARPRRSGPDLVLRAPEALHRGGHAAGVVEDLREAHDGDDVLRGDLAPVDLFEEVDELVVAAELGVVVLDVSRREIGQLHHLDGVDHGLEDALARRVLVADGDQHELVLAVLPRLVPEADRRGLATAL